MVKNLPEGEAVSVPGSVRLLREDNGNPLQYSCLEILMDGGAWWATVRGFAKSQTQLSNFTSPSLKKHRDPRMTRLNSAFKTEQERKCCWGPRWPC